MRSTVRKIGKNAKYIVLFFLCYLPARILRHLHPHYRHLWLIGERGNDARDNGYWLFHYLRTKKQRINACYVITKDSPDYDRAASIGAVVETGSIRHHLMYFAADYLIGTHVQPAAPRNWTYYRLARRGIAAKGKQVFLQHGITKDDVAYLHFPGLKIDLFVCGAEPEKKYISETYDHPSGVVRYLGFCRYDSLISEELSKREILVMPTWRSDAYPRGESFLQTSFYRNYQDLLNAPALTDLLERMDMRLVFYPHTEMQKELHRFHASSDRIVLADQEHYDVQMLLRRCSLLITDYSSVFFDVAYMEKPVIYYQFDEEEYRRFLYKEGYFSYERDGFGPLVRTQEELLTVLGSIAERGFEQSPVYRERTKVFFPMRDHENCERTYHAIKEI